MSDYTRFTRWQITQHAIVLVLFVVLCLTGLPQRYFESGWAATLLAALGGVDSSRWLHRAAGVAFSVMLVVHVTELIVRLWRGNAGLSMVPHKQDLLDALTTLRYYIGRSDTQARFDRFDYKQKFEYWGMLMGSLVVVSTGLILLFPIAVTTWLPGGTIPVAVVAHSNEGLLAFLTIVIWHIFNACLTPDVFPIDTSIFTGRISAERLHHEHPLEYERILKPLERAAAPDPPM
jgi:formate dehydrogenase subunit gamma